MLVDSELSFSTIGHQDGRVTTRTSGKRVDSAYSDGNFCVLRALAFGMCRTAGQTEDGFD